MTVTVGTDVYLSVADADTYWSNRNDAVWSAASTAAKEKALREATQYIDGAYSFIGWQDINHALCFPRYYVYIRRGNFAGKYYDNETIPPMIQDACAELAYEALSSRLVEVKDRGGAIKREKVDVIEVEYLPWAPTGKTYRFVSMLLKPLLKSTRGMKGLTRS